MDCLTFLNSLDWLAAEKRISEVLDEHQQEDSGSRKTAEGGDGLSKPTNSTPRTRLVKMTLAEAMCNSSYVEIFQGYCCFEFGTGSETKIIEFHQIWRTDRIGSRPNPKDPDEDLGDDPTVVPCMVLVSNLAQQTEADHNKDLAEMNFSSTSTGLPRFLFGFYTEDSPIVALANSEPISKLAPSRLPVPWLSHDDLVKSGQSDHERMHIQPPYLLPRRYIPYQLQMYKNLEWNLFRLDASQLAQGCLVKGSPENGKPHSLQLSFGGKLRIRLWADEQRASQNKAASGDFQRQRQNTSESVDSYEALQKLAEGLNRARKSSKLIAKTRILGGNEYLCAVSSEDRARKELHSKLQYWLLHLDTTSGSIGKLQTEFATLAGIPHPQPERGLIPGSSNSTSSRNALLLFLFDLQLCMVNHADMDRSVNQVSSQILDRLHVLEAQQRQYDFDGNMKRLVSEEDISETIEKKALSELPQLYREQIHLQLALPLDKFDEWLNRPSSTMDFITLKNGPSEPILDTEEPARPTKIRKT